MIRSQRLPISSDQKVPAAMPPTAGSGVPPFDTFGLRASAWGLAADWRVVTDVPETRYAKTEDGVHIAYQVVGSGPVDLVWLDNWATPLEARWDEPRLAALLRRLASFARLICFDKRGIGMSDPVPVDALTTPEAWRDDILTVMGAVGSTSAAITGINDGGPTAMFFAATYPQRTSGLVLVNTSPTLMRGPGYPWGLAPERGPEVVAWTRDHWAGKQGIDRLAPSLADDESFVRFYGMFRRLQASPETAARLREAHLRTDARGVLAAIQAPTLVLYRHDDHYLPPEGRAYLPDHIPGAQAVGLPGADNLWWSGDGDAVVDEIQTFLTGVRPPPEPNRVLVTVLFLDIVESTQTASRLGDREWHRVLKMFRTSFRAQLEAFGGREVNTRGDDVLATFDGPARAVRCACAIIDAVGLPVRAGLHTGEVELMGGDIGGIGVHIGARVCELAGPGEVLVSRTVTDLVAGSGIGFEDRGEHELKGVPGTWGLFAVRG